jgi:hypothetical protein
MRAIRFAAVVAAGVAFAGPVQAETRIFVIGNDDGYGIDRCLAAGERCGEAAATALCKARQYAEAVQFGRIDPAEITGGGARVARCEGSACAETIAITCSR